MDNRPSYRPTPQLVLGLVIICLGILLTLDNLNIVRAGEFLRYWPALLLAYGAYRLMEPGDPPRFFAGILFTVIGGVLLLNALRFQFAFHLFWPLLIVLLGLAIVSHAFQRGHGISTDNASTVTAVAIMSGVQRTCRAQSFRGGEFTAIMGGCEIDLRQAAIEADEAVINIFAFWGGIEFKVPDNWAVSAEILPLLGGCDDRTQAHGEGPHKRLVIKGLAIMGGVEVRN